MKVRVVKWVTSALYRVQDSRLQVTRFGLSFPNPVGLAAGLDKDAEWFDSLHTLGFGFLEVGSVTANCQGGNDKPRLFRLPADEALLNRMGCNNSGASAVASQLATHSDLPILGINIGKSANVPNEEAPSDYLASFEQLFPYASYFALNISSPNTLGLRKLQAKESLSVLLNALTERNRELSLARKEPPKPILVKIAPDLDDSELDDIVELCSEHRLGMIVANTTILRDGLVTPEEKVRSYGSGGISGKPLTQRALELVGKVYRKSQGTIPIIGVGGIMCGEDAWQMIRAGASLIQVHTGLIYAGPGLVASINRHLVNRLSEAGKSSLEEVIGEASRTAAAETLPMMEPAAPPLVQ